MAEVKETNKLTKEMLIDGLSKKFDKNREEFEQNLCLASPQQISYKDMPDGLPKTYLEVLYSKKGMKPEEIAHATIMKSLLIQKKVFFSLSRDALLLLLASDPDIQFNESDFNKKPRKTKTNPDGKPKIILNRISAKLAQFEIYQLWTHKGLKAGGYICAEPYFLEILDLSPEQLVEQYNALQGFCGNYSMPIDEILDSVGDIRYEILKNKYYISNKKENIIHTTDESGHTTDELVVTSESGNVDSSDDQNIYHESNSGFIDSQSNKIHPEGALNISDLSNMHSVDDKKSSETNHTQSKSLKAIPEHMDKDQDSSNPESRISTKTGMLLSAGSGKQFEAEKENFTLNCFVGKTKTTRAIDCIVDHYQRFTHVADLDNFVEHARKIFGHYFKDGFTNSINIECEEFNADLKKYLDNFNLKESEEQDIVYIVFEIARSYLRADGLLENESP